MSKQKNDFSLLRKYLWPIHMNELAKVLPACLMFFCIVYVYTSTRIIKDSQVVAFGEEGSLPIPFLKLFVLATSLSYTLFYTYISNKVDKSTILYSICAFFFCFYSLFAYFVMPNHEALKLMSIYTFMMTNMPFLKGLAIVIRDWDISLFYVISELFGSIMISAEFYILANNISKISEAKRFYAVFGLIANAAGIFAGYSVRFFTSIKYSELTRLMSWVASLQNLTMTFMAGIIIITISYAWIVNVVMKDPKLVDPEQFKKTKVRPSMSIRQTFSFLAKSPHMSNLVILIFAYGFSVNIIEVLWKNSWKMYFQHPAQIAEFQGAVTMAIGTSTLFVSLFISHNVLRIFSWSTVAYLTPILISIASAPFLATIIFGASLDQFVYSITGWLPAAGFLSVYLGAFQNVITKSSKYALFDPTKEVVYIARDPETKSKGKVAVDIVGARGGKASGSVEKVLEGAVASSLTQKGIITSAFVFGMIAIWMFAINRLGKLMNDEVANSQ